MNTEGHIELGNLKEVDVFEKDNQLWIKHDGGDCPVPDDWKVIVAEWDGWKAKNPLLNIALCLQLYWCSAKLYMFR